MVSVIVNTYNRVNVLTRCLEALGRQAPDTPDFEVIVVDDGSTDGTRACAPRLCRGLGVPARFLSIDHAGPAAARNRGVSASRGELLIFLGDDILVAPDFVKAHAESDRGPDAAAVVGRTCWHPEIRVTPFMALIERNGWQFGYGCMRDPDDLPYTYFYTSNLSLPRSWLEMAAFDEEFRHAAYEDVDLGYRLKRNGLRITHNAAAIGYHYHPYSFAGFVERSGRVAREAERFHRKHPELNGWPGRPTSRAAVALGRLCTPATRTRVAGLTAQVMTAADVADIRFRERTYLRVMRLIRDLSGPVPPGPRRTRPGPAAPSGQDRDVDRDKISVVVPVHNGMPYLKALLPTLRSQSGVRFDITVVDDASTDPGMARYLASHEDIRLVRTPRNLGFAGACNTGIRSTDGEYVFILNNDTELAPDCLRSLLRVAAADASVGVAGCTVLNRDGTIWTTGGLLGNGFPRDLTDPIGEARDAEHLAFCAVLVRRRALAEVGPLDERYFMKFEDVDFSERLRRRTGYRIRVLPRALVTHTGVHASLTSTDGLYYRERNRLLFQRKFYPRAAARNAFRRLPRRIVNSGLVILKQLCLGRLSEARHNLPAEASLVFAWAHGTWRNGGRRHRA